MNSHKLPVVLATKAAISLAWRSVKLSHDVSPDLHACDISPLAIEEGRSSARAVPDIRLSRQDHQIMGCCYGRLLTDTGEQCT